LNFEVEFEHVECQFSHSFFIHIFTKHEQSSSRHVTLNY